MSLHAEVHGQELVMEKVGEMAEAIAPGCCWRLQEGL